MRVNDPPLLGVCLAAFLAIGPARLFPAANPQSPSTDATKPLPTAQQIIDRYLQAIGGRETLLKFTSRHIRGTAEFAPGLIGALQIFEKAPNKLLVEIDLEGRKVREGFDGQVGWTADAKNGVREKTGDESADAARSANFHGLLNQLERYSKLTVEGRAQIGGRQAYRLEGVLLGRGTETLYYDVETGLLLKRVNVTPGPEGERTESTFEEYREVDGLKYPFTHRMVTNGRTLVLRVITLKHNIPIDDSRFAKPAAPAAP